MVAIARPVGPNRYRESHGRYFEEFTVGDVYEHRPGRTIGEEAARAGGIARFVLYPQQQFEMRRRPDIAWQPCNQLRVQAQASTLEDEAHRVRVDR